MGKITLPPSGLAEDIFSQTENGPGELQLVTFTIGEQYGVPISQVQEIIRIGTITKVPNSIPYMEGVINLRGRILPVLNLRKRLHLPLQDITRDSRIVVIEAGNKTIGLLVDSVSQVMKVSSELIDKAPEEVLEINSDYITGVCKLQESIVIMIDLERLIKRENIEIKEEGQGSLPSFAQSKGAEKEDGQ
ncbi:MAG TPA: chemotaxis protein CheW [Thermodesulfovibrionales bacterium]|nr:chemotaxis protein CheW [Thermodesulfovibrionales bacterium]